MEIKQPKGTKDTFGKDKDIKDYIISILKKNFEIYGFNALDTPAFESYEVLASKYAGGEEILKEIFKFKDQGGRDLGLRYDLTVPLARFITMNPQMKLPFKRYQIGSVWRDGPIKLGRYREFTQCDVDTIGSKNLIADAELLSLANKIFNELSLKYKFLINNRKLLDDVLIKSGVKLGDLTRTILLLDKLDKVSQETIKDELRGFLDGKTIENILSYLKFNFLELKNEFKNSEGYKELETLFNYLKQMNVRNFEFSLKLARGLNYYTGNIFEAYLIESEIKSSIAAGGRYDRMINDFIQDPEKKFCAVGISFGLDVLMDALKLKKEKFESKLKEVFVISINRDKEALELTSFLRNNDLRVEIDLMNRNIGKNLDYANSVGINYVIFIGDEEIKKKRFKLRDMNSGKEELLTKEDLIKKLK
ncbi:histidine--tRNA ligase [Candidatus Woesearchaeota archaeon]|nr:histidine--tRNA ligase [Candidatus Woesearchaeota archaeon]